MSTYIEGKLREEFSDRHSKTRKWLSDLCHCPLKGFMLASYARDEEQKLVFHPDSMDFMQWNLLAKLKFACPDIWKHTAMFLLGGYDNSDNYYYDDDDDDDDVND